MQKFTFDDAGNGNPPPKDDPTKKPLRQPAPAPDSKPLEDGSKK